MRQKKSAMPCDPLKYLTPDELDEIDEQFSHTLPNSEGLVFWTGIHQDFARLWAVRHSMATLSIALGPLTDDSNPQSPRSRKKQRAFSKYMKGASCRFAEFAYRRGFALVLTNPPPNIYSTRPNSNFKDLEEPILTKHFSSVSTTTIVFVHPTVPGAEDFRYQMWPENRCAEWIGFVRHHMQSIRDGTSMVKAAISWGNTRRAPKLDKGKSMASSDDDSRRATSQLQQKKTKKTESHKGNQAEKSNAKVGKEKDLQKAPVKPKKSKKKTPKKQQKSQRQLAKAARKQEKAQKERKATKEGATLVKLRQMIKKANTKLAAKQHKTPERRKEENIRKAQEDQRNARERREQTALDHRKMAQAKITAKGRKALQDHKRA